MKILNFKYLNILMRSDPGLSLSSLLSEAEGDLHDSDPDHHCRHCVQVH